MGLADPPTPPLETAKLNISRLTKPIKFRIIDELKTVFRGHPVFKNLEQHIQNKYAFDERPALGIVVSNISGDLIRLSPDNFVGTILSHVFLARVAEYKGRSIEWVREDAEGIQAKVTEDVSNQLDGTKRFFQVQNTPIVDPRTGEYATRPLSLRVTINAVPTLPADIHPMDGTVFLDHAPRITDVVKITYHYRTLEPQGIYYTEITGKNEFVVDPLYVIDDEVLTSSYDGSQTQFQIQNYPLLGEPIDVWRDQRIELIQGTEYTVDTETGILTLINPDMPSGTILTVSYKYPGVSRGPFPIIKERSNNQAIKGVVIAFEQGIEEGDKQAIIIRNTREQVSQAFGGKWDLSLSLNIYARDPTQREELTDVTVSVLWEGLKPRLDREGIVIKNVSHGGEAEELYAEVSGDYYYTSALTLDLETDWELHKPLPFAFRRFDYVLGGAEAVREAEGDTTSSMQLKAVLPDEDPVIRVGYRNFERLA